MNFAHRKNDIWLVFLISLTVAFGLYAHTIKGSFVGDDHTIVENREDLYDLKNVPGFFLSPAFPDKPSIRLYRPLTLISYAFNFSLSKSSAGFHVLNLFLHALSSVLVFFIISKLATRRVAWLAFLAFIFLPIHVESFVPIVGRSEILSSFFMLLSLFWFIEKRFFLSSVSFLLALFSKDFAVILLPLFSALLLLELIDDYRDWKNHHSKNSGSEKKAWFFQRLKRALKIGLYYLPSLAIYFLLRYFALGKYAFGSFIFNPVTAPLAFLNIKERILTGFYGFYIYLRNTFLPINLVPDYSYNQMPAVGNLFSSPGAIIGLLLLIFFVILIFIGKREIKIASLIILIPFVFISNMFFITSGSFAERWWYFPSLGLVFLVAMGMDWFISKYRKVKKILLVMTVLIFTWYSYLAFEHSSTWFNDKVFYVKTAKKAANNAWARSNLAAVYLNDKQFDEAWQEAKAALAIHDKYPPTLNIIGQLYWSENNFVEAEAAFKKAIEFDIAGRNTSGLYRLLAFLNIDYGKNVEAAAYMKKSLESSTRESDQRVAKVNAVLYKMFQDFEKHDPRLYSDAEKAELVRLIKLIRGF